MINCNQKKKGPQSHSTLTVCMTPSDHVFLIYFAQPKPLIFSQIPSCGFFPMYSIRSETYKSFTLTDQQNRVHNIHLLPLTFTKMLTSTSFHVSDYVHRPKAQAFYLQNVHKNIRFLLRSNLSRILLQQLGQVPGVVESYSNQPSSLS